MNNEQNNDLEAIRQLKARYIRNMDTKQWDSWGECFTPDISAAYEGSPRASRDHPLKNEVVGSEELVNLCSQLFEGVTTMHQAFLPEIELTSETTASAIWAMFDYIKFPTCNFKGWGHYHDDYVKVDGQWKIKKIYLTRTNTEEEWL
jgi:hypothetical protein